MRPGPHMLHNMGADDAEDAVEAADMEDMDTDMHMAPADKAAVDKVDGRALEAVSRCPCRLVESIWVRRPLLTSPSGLGVPRTPPSLSGRRGALTSSYHT